MTTYNAGAVADAAIAHKKGITLQTGRALRDNPLAIIEGVPGSPPISGSSFGRDFASDPSKYLPVVSVSASDDVVIAQGLEKVVSEMTSTAIGFVNVGYTVRSYSGSIRFRLPELSAGTQSLYRNGNLVGSVATGGGLTPFVDSSVSIGDVLEWRNGSTYGFGPLLDESTETASDGYVVVTPYGLSSSNI